jgi:hypothetical protein
MSNAATEAIAENLEKLITEAVETAIDDIDFEDKIDLTDYCKQDEVGDYIDYDDLADRVKDCIDIDQAVKDEVGSQFEDVETLYSGLRERVTALEAPRPMADLAGMDDRVQKLERSDRDTATILSDHGDEMEGLASQIATLRRQVEPVLKLYAILAACLKETP